MVSSAISTSTIRPSAVCMLFDWFANESALKLSLDWVPPFCARRNEIFSNAVVKTPTDICPKLSVSESSSLAKVR